jgi:hypothetical protein
MDPETTEKIFSPLNTSKKAIYPYDASYPYEEMKSYGKLKLHLEIICSE